MNPAILAIESSCDETAVALVRESGEVVAELVHSQISLHQAFGGVVPEVASRAHFEILDDLVRELLQSAPGLEIRAVAATKGPGLVGPLIVGACYAEGLAVGWGLPFVGVHHLRGHLASVLLGHGPQTLKERAAEIFPALVLLVSGGHTQVLAVEGDLRAQKWAETADDAAGECFDKSAKLMGLPYPGGPAIEKLAGTLSHSERTQADGLRRKLPRPRSAAGFSFAGLKTAIRLSLERDPSLAQSAAFAWAVQESIAESLCQGLDRALKDRDAGDFRRLIFCGGVSANLRLRAAIGAWASAQGLDLVTAPLKYCTDNAAMIGAAAWTQDPSLAPREIFARGSLEL